MNILFISSMDYIIGGAAQHRHKNIFRELKNNNANVSLINLQDKKNLKLSIPHKNFPDVTSFLPWKIKLWLYFIPMLIKTLLAKEKTEIIVCLDRNFLIMGIAIFFAKLFGVRIFHEITEYPDVVVKNNISGRLTILLFERIYIKRLNGLIVISRALIEYVKSKGNSNVFLLPSIVNIKTHHNTAESVNLECINFTYMGSLSQEKDGVLDMIAAFNECKKQILDKKMVLNIYGGGIQKELTDIKQLIETLNIGEQVVLHGHTTKENIEKALNQASALLHCRPLSRQAKGGFSTKFTEYLITGKPVITTITSDITRYCIDGQNAFLVPPNDIDLFAKKMEYVVNNEVIIAEVGGRGKILAETYFDSGKRVAELYLWLSGASQI